MTDQIVYLVSGASRGMGLGLVKALSERDNAIIYAGIRDVTKPGNGLAPLVRAHPDKVILVQLNSGDPSDANAAAATIKAISGKLDVVVANAGVCTYFGPLLSTPVELFDEHFKINTLGPLVLFQGVGSLLLRSPTPKFVLISSGASSMAEHLPIPASAYGVSKAGANYLICKMHAEHSQLVATAYAPGYVATEFAKDAPGAEAVTAILQMAPTPVEESLKALLLHLDTATRDGNGGRFWDWHQNAKQF